ncbi:AMP-binding protein [Sphingomonas morindae]|uniref:Long-chain-fatty-acid--CoA ligase n=1 Tax=Sphingomonas morindae TaxID=1541170 RepID=A0ABY4X6F1_9SPHN|nr:AMP-binding protein [Sphingomonas morindae]USI72461.1 AMP-binding protein [Sphingomonas morindae]
MARLSDRLAATGLAGDHVLVEDAIDRLTVAEALHADLPAIAAGSAVALQLHDPLLFVRHLFALDGRASALLLLAPALPDDVAAERAAAAGCTRLIRDAETRTIEAAPAAPRADGATRWLMTTSGTTGVPKIVAHDLDTLTRSVRPPRAGMAVPIWGLLYEPSRFAGLQVVLQALLGGGRLLAAAYDEPLPERLTRFAAQGCTHLSATPSLWRKILMLPQADGLALKQVTLGGEIADQPLLTQLRRRFPDARLTHVYASTEVGVGFAVTDGEAGFPASYLRDGVGGVQLKIVDGLLWARPPGAATRDLAPHMQRDADNYLCTSDRVEQVGERVRFLGRESSTVNIGGTKVQIEDVEQIVSRHPDVAECVVTAKPNPIVGAVLSLTIAPRDPEADRDALRKSVKDWCRVHLQREAQPATVRVVDALEVTAAGKISRI